MIKIYCIGKIKEEWLRSLIDNAIKTSQYPIMIVEKPDIECPNHYSPALQEQVKNKECESLLASISNHEVVVALDLVGTKANEAKFKNIINQHQDIAFVIGGSLGLSDELKRRAKYSLNLSKMTFTHQFARLMLVEAISEIKK